MLSKEKIAEAQANVRTYLADGLLKRAKVIDANVLQVLKHNYLESLKVAELLFSNNHSNLWTIVCSYYAMFYIANAVIYVQGYKVGHKIAHQVTADALMVYVKDKLKDVLLVEYEETRDAALEIAGVKAEELVASFDAERLKRSQFQYEMTEVVKQSKAQTSLERAKAFIFEMEKLL